MLYPPHQKLLLKKKKKLYLKGPKPLPFTAQRNSKPSSQSQLPPLPFTEITGKNQLFILTTLIIIAKILIDSEKTENNNWAFENFKYYPFFKRGTHV